MGPEGKDSMSETLSSSTGSDRRRQQRHTVRLGVTLTSESNLYVGFADNISEGGLFVATHELMPIGTAVDLEFELPERTEPLRVRGEVRWQRAVSDLDDHVFPGFGVKFIDLGEREAKAIAEFLETREPIFHPDL